MNSALAPLAAGRLAAAVPVGASVPLNHVLSVVDGVAREFRERAPSRSAATLIEAVLLLVNARLQGLPTVAILPETGAVSGPPTRLADPALRLSEDAASTPAPAPDTGNSWKPREDVMSARIRERDNVPTAGEPASASPLPECEPAPRTPTPHAVTRASDMPPAQPAAPPERDATPSSTPRSTVTDAAPADAHPMIDPGEREGSPRASAPPDEYDGLCAVGSRLFAAAAATA